MPTPSASAKTQYGLHGIYTRRYGSFGSKTIQAVASADQIWLALPEPAVEVRRRHAWVPFANNTGSDLEIGDVVCRAVDADGDSEAAIPSSTVLYMPWGVVFARDVPNGTNGYLGTGGVFNCKVLGASGLVAGKVLTAVAGQTYLQDSGLTLSGGHHYPFVLQEDHQVAQTVLRRVLVRTLA